MPNTGLRIGLSLTASLLLAMMPLAHAGDFVDLVKRCESCHGQDGNSSIAMIPSIAGFSY